MGDKREYAGAKGEVARGADQVYDTAANAIMHDTWMGNYCWT
jgi:hypothetical protein